MIEMSSNYTEVNDKISSRIEAAASVAQKFKKNPADENLNWKLGELALFLLKHLFDLYFSA